MRPEARPPNHDPHPNFHFGWREVQHYFFCGQGESLNVGNRHTFKDIEPYCHTHGDRSYHDYDSPDAPCDTACEYGMRFTAER